MSTYPTQVILTIHLNGGTQTYTATATTDGSPARAGLGLLDVVAGDGTEFLQRKLALERDKRRETDFA